MEDELKLIKQVAGKVRKACSSFAHSIDASSYDFFVYSYGSYNNGLCGMCAIASFTLRDELREAGIKANVIRGSYFGRWLYGTHCWVKVADKYIVDVTATQFNQKNPAVLITDLNDARYTDAKLMRGYKLFNDWPSSQRPDDEIVKKLKMIIRKEYKPVRANAEQFSINENW